MKVWFIAIGFSFFLFSACKEGKGFYHVYPGESIQDTLEKAAKDPLRKRIKVHAGTYRPSAKGEALIWFNARHDGITLETDGDVILTAANPEIADPKAPSYPAVVNHVVYFGDRISRKTVFRGFKITGANHFVSGSGQTSPIESNTSLKKSPFFYTDGGGIKIFGESSPTIEDVEIAENYASPCGGGVSVEQVGFNRNPVLFKNVVFRDNRAQNTGSAVDLLSGSSAIIDNSLFVGNISNIGNDELSRTAGQEPYNHPYGSGALTVFAGSSAEVRNSTFTDNGAGVDDKGSSSSYYQTIFWNNAHSGGISHGPRYELDLLDGGRVRGCFIHGNANDIRGIIDRSQNRFDPPAPNFDLNYVPRSIEYSGIGYRPSR